MYLRPGRSQVPVSYPKYEEQTCFYFSAPKNCNAGATAGLETDIPWRATGIPADYDATTAAAAEVGLFYCIS